MLLEICVDRLDSANAALAGGAHRLEICGALGVGGVTPSIALLEACVELAGANTDCVALIRPHEGGFVYDRLDKQIILADIARVQQAGAGGVAVGALLENGRIDVEFIRRVCDVADPAKVTFHRAFDLAVDAFQALDELSDLQVRAVLTSGQAETAVQGAEAIARFVRRVDDRPALIAGAGVNSNNVLRLIEQTGVREIHASASQCESSAAAMRFGGRPRRTSRLEVERLSAALRSV